MEKDEKSVLALFCQLNGIAVPDTLDEDVIALDVEGLADFWIVYLGDGEVEIMSRIDGLDVQDPGTLRMLLEANYMGLATDEARLSIDPIEPRVVLSERWPYHRLLADDVQEDLHRFANLVASWRSDGVATIQAKARGEDDYPPDPDNATILAL
jgi:hypothetical protein